MTSRRRLFAPQRDVVGAGFSRQEALSALSDGVLWAMAQFDKSLYVAGDDGLVLRQRGGVWERESSGTLHALHALCVDDRQLWAVGWLGVICVRQNGAWQLVSGGERNHDRLNLPLFDIARAPDGVLWCVGDQGRVVRITDGLPEEMSAPTSANLRTVLAFEDGRVLVAGSNGAALWYRDAQWQPADTGTTCNLTGLTVAADAAIYAVGGEYAKELGGFRGRVFRVDGDRWSAVDPGCALPRLRRVRRFGRAVVLVGDQGAVYLLGTGGVMPLDLGTRVDIQDAQVLDAGGLGFCGDRGSVHLPADDSVPTPQSTLVPAEPEWTVADLDTRATLRALHPFADGTIVAVGDAGASFICRKGSWQSIPAPGEIDLHAVWGTSPGNVFAVGSGSTILHFDGERWSTAHRFELDTTLLGITGFGPHDIFVMGDGGFAARYDGLMWRHHALGTQQEFYAIWGADPRHVLAVGGAGTLARWNGDNWRVHHLNTDNDLYSVNGANPVDVRIVGLNGTVMRYDGQQFVGEHAGVRNDLHAITHLADGRAIAVGSSGTLIEHNGTHWRPTSAPAAVTLYGVAGTRSALTVVGRHGFAGRVRLDT